MLTIADLDTMFLDCRKTMDMKTDAALQGHDWVITTKTISVYKLAELVALARLGLPLFQAFAEAHGGAPPPIPEKLQNRRHLPEFLLPLTPVRSGDDEGSR